MDDLDPLADLDPLSWGDHASFLQPLDLLTGDDDANTGGASSSQAPPTHLPFHGPNSPASQETFPDEVDPEFLTTDEEALAEDEACQGESMPERSTRGGEGTPNFGGTIGWTETIDIIPGVTDIEQLMQEPWGDEEPDLQETNKGERDSTGGKDVEKREDRHEHRGRASGSCRLVYVKDAGRLGVDGTFWGRKFTYHKKKSTSKIAFFRDLFDAEQHVPPQPHQRLWHAGA